MHPKPFSIEMPNQFNFAIDFEYVLYSSTFIYAVLFPQNYMYMWAQRKSFYRELAISNKFNIKLIETKN